MDEILAGILTPDFWVGFVGAVVATAYLSQPVFAYLAGRIRCLPNRLLGVIIAVLIGTLVAWLWAVVGDDGLKLRSLLRDGIVNGAASSIVYENVIKPWLKKKAGGA